MKRNKWLMLLVAGLSLALLVACAQPAPSPAPKPSPAPAPSPTTSPAPKPTPAPTPSPAAKKIPVLIAGPPATFGTYPTIVGTADLISRKSNLDITVRSYAGSSAAMQAVIERKADFSGPASATAFTAYMSVGDFAGKPPAKHLRAGINFTLLWEGFVTTTKSGITTIPDLKGKKVAWYTAHRNEPVLSILKAYNIDPEKDFKLIRMPAKEEGAKELAMGRIDAYWSGLEPRGYILELAEAVGGKLVALPIDPDKLKWAAEKFPMELSGSLTGYIKPNQISYFPLTQPMPIVESSINMSTHKDVSNDVVYTYVKGWLDNYKEVRAIADRVKDFGPEIAATPFVIPYHDGAIKAFKEAGIWTKEMEQSHQDSLKR